MGPLSSSSDEISESRGDVNDYVQHNELWANGIRHKTYQCLCNSHLRCLKGRVAWSRRTHLRLLQAQPLFVVIGVYTKVITLGLK